MEANGPTANVPDTERRRTSEIVIVTSTIRKMYFVKNAVGERFGQLNQVNHTETGFHFFPSSICFVMAEMAAKQLCNNDFL